ncbi:MAG: tetratricopeptide repeat protein [Deltaproteobacteria bacterium]|nr:tetratricopeptide repeat protein [Deltaproteobacteria bacterium]
MRALRDRMARWRSARLGLAALLAVAALSTRPPLARAAASYGDAMALAWSSLQRGEAEAAARAYAEAAALVPESEDAWLGLQLARLTQRDWSAALAAGERALALNPQSRWAQARQGYAHAMRGEPQLALPHYERAVALAPDDAELRLGLGLSLVGVGRVEEGRESCRRAADTLGADSPLVAECLGATRGDALTFRAAATASYGGYQDPWEVRDIRALTLSAGLAWGWGAGVWAGATLSESTLQYGLGDYRQANGVLGLWVDRQGWRAHLDASYLGATDERVDGAWFADGGLGYGTDAARADLALVLGAWPDFQTLQPRATLSFGLGARATLSLGGELGLILDDPQGPGGTELLGCGLLGLVWRPVDALVLTLGGYGGHRRYAAQASLLDIWPTRDRFVGGWQLDLAWWPVRAAGIHAGFTHDIGDQRSGRSDRFQLFRGQVTLELRL